MDKFHIVGPTRLAGRVQASGAKNAALPALTASLLSDEPLRLRNVPRVRDIRTLQKLLDHLGIAAEETEDVLTLRRERPNPEHDAPYDLVKTMRASVLVLGPLVAKEGHARVSLPGGAPSACGRLTSTSRLSPRSAPTCTSRTATSKPLPSAWSAPASASTCRR